MPFAFAHARICALVLRIELAFGPGLLFGPPRCRAEKPPQCPGVIGVEVYFVIPAVDGEADRLFSGAVVQIIDQGDKCLCSHLGTLPAVHSYSGLSGLASNCCLPTGRADLKTYFLKPGSADS